MSLNKTPSSNRVHIAILGRRNAGKSSLINAISGQDIALVSPIAGTTTDPVHKAMELHGAGPVVFIDTPGIDDEGELGGARVSRTLRTLRKTDVAVLVVDATQGFGQWEERLLKELWKRSLPVIGVVNKLDEVRDGTDLVEDISRRVSQLFKKEHNFSIPTLPGSLSKNSSLKKDLAFVGISALTGLGVQDLITRLIQTIKEEKIGYEPAIVGDLLTPGDVVFLVIPVDLEAPKGRLILPQVQTLRDILDHDCVGVMAKVSQLREALNNSKRTPRLVVTDSQAFKEVDEIVPPHIPLTSFSILFARYKGDFKELIKGTRALERLKPGDSVLIAEACTHHPIEDDIGRVKIPNWLQRKVGGKLDFAWCRGMDYPDDVERFKVIIHCGGCMFNRKEMLSRIRMAREAGVPITNYGMTIAYAHGILKRALTPFGVET